MPKYKGMEKRSPMQENVPVSEGYRNRIKGHVRQFWSLFCGHDKKFRCRGACIYPCQKGSNNFSLPSKISTVGWGRSSWRAWRCRCFCCHSQCTQKEHETWYNRDIRSKQKNDFLNKNDFSTEKAFGSDTCMHATESEQNPTSQFSHFIDVRETKWDITLHFDVFWSTGEK